MHTLLQSRHLTRLSGEALPAVWPSLAARGTQFRRGQLVLLAAGPGAGKSAAALDLAVKSGASTLYFSADSDAFTQLSRTLCMITGMTLSQASDIVKSDQIDVYADRLKELPIKFSFTTCPTIRDVEAEVQAWEEIHGDHPELIIVDNLSNVDAGTDSPDPFASLEVTCDVLHGMARTTGACVLALHHVTGPFVDGGKPIPLSGVKSQATRVPALVLTMHRTINHVNISTVKNRFGPSDSSGETYAFLEFDGETMTIRDPRSPLKKENNNKDEAKKYEAEKVSTTEWQVGEGQGPGLGEQGCPVLSGPWVA